MTVYLCETIYLLSTGNSVGGNTIWIVFVLLPSILGGLRIFSIVKTAKYKGCEKLFRKMF